jgi:hypothetical protein
MPTEFMTNTEIEGFNSRVFLKKHEAGFLMNRHYELGKE